MTVNGLRRPSLDPLPVRASAALAAVAGVMLFLAPADAAGQTVAVEDASAGEGLELQFNVRLSTHAPADVVLGWSTGDDDTAGARQATAGTDYTAETSGTVTITKGTDLTYFLVQTTADTLAEGDETFKVTITGTTLPPGVTIGTPTAVGTILDDDAVNVWVQAASASEGSPLSFMARLTKPAGADVVLGWSTGNDDTAGARQATAGTDYTAVTGGTVTLSAGQTAATLTVQTTADTDAEGDETLEVTITGTTLPTGVVVQTDTAVGTILDDDATKVSVEAASATDGTALSFTVRLSKAASSNVVLGWSTGNDDTAGARQATAGTDYTAVTSGAVTIPAGRLTSTLTVQTLSDTEKEPDETLKVTITGTALPTGVVVQTDTAVGTILDDDAIHVTVADDSAQEGSQFWFRVRLSKAASRDVTVGWLISADDTPGANQATAAVDYWQFTRLSVTIPAGDTVRTQVVQTFADRAIEGDETLKFTLTETTPAGIALPAGVFIRTATAVGTIRDHTATVSVTGGSAVEGSNAPFTVQLSRYLIDELVLSVSTGDDNSEGANKAIENTDYRKVTSGQVKIPAFKTSGTWAVATITDSTRESNETFTVTIAEDATTKLPDYLLIENATAIMTILDGNTPAVSVGPASATEGSALSFPVTLSEALPSNVVLAWSTGADDTAGASPATAGTDYTAVSGGSATITAGQTATTLTVQTAGDELVEGDETLKVTITATTLPDGVVIRTATAVGTIVDDAVTVSVGPASATEGLALSFPVTLSKAVASDVVLGWSTGADDTAGANPATAGTDYTAVSGGSVTIAAGDTTATLTVQTKSDQVEEHDETLKVTITGTTLPAKVFLGTATAVGTIVDPVVVSLGPASAIEGSALSFPVTLSKAFSKDIFLAWSTRFDSRFGANPATAGTDYTAVSGGSVAIRRGETAATLTVQTKSDAEAEDDETLEVVLTGPNVPPGVVVGTQNAVGTILEPVLVSVGPARAPEGLALSFPVTLSEAASADVVLGWSTVSITFGHPPAHPGVDYTAVTSGSVTITRGQTRATLTVQTTEDEAVEGDEQFGVAITGIKLPAEVAIKSERAFGTIVDDESVRVSVGPAMATEGSALDFKVTLSRAVATNVVVGIATSDDDREGARQATAGTDYTRKAGSVTVLAGQTESAAFSVATQADTDVEGVETFLVTISKQSVPAGVELGTATAVGTILDAQTVSVLVGPAASATEGSSMEFKVTLSKAASADVTVNVFTSDDDREGARQATADTDYQVTGSARTFTAGQTESAAFSVATIVDTAREGPETFQVQIAEREGAALPTGVEIGIATAVGTIVDAQTVSVGPASATEGTALSFPVTLERAVGSDVVLGWSTGDDDTAGARQATADTDYTSVTSGSVTVTAGQTTATLTVQTTQDAALEGDETLKVTITGTTLPAGVRLGTATAVGTIVDDDAVRVSVAAASATEGTALSFPVQLSAAVTSDVVLGWSTGDDDTAGARQATADTDYTSVTGGSVTITAGQTTATLTVQTTQDAATEGDETLKVTITGTTLPTGVFLGTATAVGTIVDDDTVTVSVAAASATEGSALSFPVTLSKEVDADVVLGWWTGADGTAGASQATADTDYTSVTGGSVTVAAGQTTATLTVRTTEDAATEDDETFKVTITGTTLPAGVVLGTATAVGTIVDDDTVTVSVGPAWATEGSALDFKVTLSKAFTTNLIVSIFTGDDDTEGARKATAGTDYTSGGATVTVLAGQTESNAFSVTTLADDAVEGPETFKVTIREREGREALPPGVEIGAATAVGTILDEDSVTVSVGPASATEGSALSFPVTLSKAAGADVVLGWSTGDDDTAGASPATAGTDYTAVTGVSVTIEAGDTTATLTVRTTDDTAFEDDETLKVTITGTTLPTGVFLTTATAVGTIVDDDGVTVSVGPASATEGTALSFPVTLSKAAGADVVLGWSTGDDDTAGANPATAGTDYTAVTGVSVTIEAGDTTATLTVRTTDDAALEEGETFKVTITGTTLPTGVTIETATAVGTIVDDDTVSVSVGPASATEGTALDFKVTLSKAFTTNLIVSIFTGDDDTEGARKATAGTDYTSRGATATVLAGQTESAAFSVTTLADDAVEGPETFKVTIEEREDTEAFPTGVEIGAATAVGTIVDEDSVTVSVAAASATEGSALSFPVTLSEAVASDVVLGWSTGDDDTPNAWQATAGTDYTAVTSSSVTITAGQTTATLTVQTTADKADEPDETLKVTITGTTLPTGVFLGTATAVGTIQDPVNVSVAAASATEGSALSFPVTLSEAVASDVVLGWSTGDDDTPNARQATADTDYTAVTSGSVTITAGQTAATLTVQTTDDMALEDDETFKVTITGTTLPTGVFLGAATAVGTILDDETANVSVAAASATEGTALSFPVTLSAAVTSDVVLGWSTGDDDTPGARQATAGTDYTAVTSGSVTITAGQTTATLTVQTTADAAAEGDETFKVTITGTTLPPGVVLGAATAIGTIEDDDGVPVSVAAASATEGTALSFTVRLSAAVTSDVVLGWSTGDDDTPGARRATAGTDYTAVTGGSVTIAASATTATLAVQTTDDTAVEGDETFKVTITGTTLPTGVVLGARTAVGTIVEDDGVRVSVEAASATEGTELSFTVRLSKAASSAVVLGWSTGDDDTAGARQATAGEDYTAVTGGSVTIAASQTTATLTVQTTDDTAVEGDETLQVTITGTTLPTDVFLGASTAVGTIVDDDAVTVSPPPPPPPPPPPNTVPGAPRNLRAVGGDGQAVLSWSPPEDDGGAPITDYEYRIDGKGDWISIGSTETQYTVSGLKNGAEYIFQVRAVNEIGAGASRRSTAEVGAALEFAHFANGDGIASDLVFVNVGTRPVRPAIYFYDSGGEPIDAESVVEVTADREITEDGAVTVLTQMEPLAELTVSTHGRGELRTGSVRVVSGAPLGGGLRFDFPHIGVAMAKAGTPIGDAIFLARRREGGINTGVAIHNLEEEPLEVSCRLMREGVVLEHASFTLAANGQVSWTIDQAFPATDLSDFSGSLRCAAVGGELFTGVGGGLFTVVALESDPGSGAFSTLPVFAVNKYPGGGAAVLDFAHFANGDGATTDLVLVHVGAWPSGPALTLFHTPTPPMRPAIYFHDTDGNPIAAESVVEVSGDLEVQQDGGLTVLTEMEPLTELTISTHGRGPLRTGSVRVVSDNRLGGMLRFDLPHIGEAVAGAGDPIGDAIFPVRRREGGINTAVAIHNLEGSSRLVRCELLREGLRRDVAMITLAANGQSSWTIDQAFPATDLSDFSGSLRCADTGGGLFTAGEGGLFTAGAGSFTVMALESDPGAGVFTTLPVFPVEKRTARE